MPETTSHQRMRDYLYEYGPSSPSAVSAACGVPIAEVLRSVDGGAFRPAARACATASCVRCGLQARINDICDECRDGLIVGALTTLRRGPRPHVATRAIVAGRRGSRMAIAARGA